MKKALPDGEGFLKGTYRPQNSFLTTIRAEARRYGRQWAVMAGCARTTGSVAADPPVPGSAGARRADPLACGPATYAPARPILSCGDRGGRREDCGRAVA